MALLARGEDRDSGTDKWNMFRFGCLCAPSRCRSVIKYIYIVFEKNEILFREKT